MPAGHLTPDLLRAMGRVAPDSLPLLAQLLAHLGAVCPDCRAVLAAYGAVNRSRRPPSATRGAGGGEELCSLLRRQLGGAVAPRTDPHRGGTERTTATAVAALLEAPAAERRLRLAGDPRLHTVTAWGELVRCSRTDFTAGDPRAAEVAELALEAAGRLDACRYGGALVADCRAVAAAALAGGRAQTGLLPAAREALEAAGVWLDQGSGDPYAAAEIRLEGAAVAAAGGALRDALALTGRAVRLYRQVEDLHCEGMARVLQALLWEELGNLPATAAALSRGLPRLDRQRAPALAALADRVVERLLPRLVLTQEEEPS